MRHAACHDMQCLFCTSPPRARVHAVAHLRCNTCNMHRHTSIVTSIITIVSTSCTVHRTVVFVWHRGFVHVGRTADAHNVHMPRSHHCSCPALVCVARSHVVVPFSKSTRRNRSATMGSSATPALGCFCHSGLAAVPLDQGQWRAAQPRPLAHAVLLSVERLSRAICLRSLHPWAHGGIHMERHMVYTTQGTSMSFVAAMRNPIFGAHHLPYFIWQCWYARAHASMHRTGRSSPKLGPHGLTLSHMSVACLYVRRRLI